jgi:hypothetical protein
MSDVLRALIVEDSEDDAEMLVRALRRGGYEVVYERVDTAGKMRASLARGSWDIVLADYSLPSFSGPAALALLKHSERDVPFLVVSGTIGEEAAVEALKAGADDFLVKGRWARLMPAIERSLRSATERRERARVESALRQSEAKHRALFEGAVFGIYQATAEGRFLTVNPALSVMLGYDSPDELVGMSASSLLVEGSRLADLQRQLGHQRQFTGEEEVWRRRTGESIRVRLSGRIIDLPGFNLPGVEVIVEDVTERRHLEDQLRQVQKMEAIGRLAGGIAHDFNNLLTAILGYSALLRERVTQPDLVSDVEEIRKAGERASTLTRQLLTFSRKQALEPRTIDLNTLVANLEKMLRRIIGEDIRLETALSPSVGLVRADPGQLEQVVINLVVNARDAMASGGVLSLQTAMTTLPSEFLGTSGEDPSPSYVVLTVTDTGCGMPADVRARMFEPFFTTKEPGRGTGLGLSTVYGIVAQNRGHIAVDTEPQRGTTVRVYLPSVNLAVDMTNVGTGDTGSVAGTETILLVDDEPSIRELAGRVLREQGYHVLDAGDSATALMITRQHPGPIDLLITDVVMPGMNGRDLARWVKSSRPGAEVLYISGYPDSSNGLPWTGSPAVCLLKPFSPQELTRKVRERLNSVLIQPAHDAEGGSASDLDPGLGSREK